MCFKQGCDGVRQDHDALTLDTLLREQCTAAGGGQYGSSCRLPDSIADRAR